MTNDNPAAQAALQGYLAAARKGDPFSLAYLGQLLQNQPDIMQNVLKGSSYGPMLADPNLGPRLQGSFFGTSFGRSLEFSSGSNGQLPSVAGMPSAYITVKITAAANKYGVPVADAFALIRKESNFQNIRSSDPNSRAAGYGQVTAGTAREMGYSPEDMLDPDKGIDAAIKYYSQQRQATGGDSAAAYERYHYGPASGRYNQRDADQFLTARQSYQNQPTVELQRQARGEAAGIQGSKYITGATDVAVIGIHKLADAAVLAAAALKRIGRTQAGPTGTGQTLGQWLQAPLEPAVPHDSGAYSTPVK